MEQTHILVLLYLMVEVMEVVQVAQVNLVVTEVQVAEGLMEVLEDKEFQDRGIKAALVVVLQQEVAVVEVELLQQVQMAQLLLVAMVVMALHTLYQAHL
jgi:hypothetical protein